MHGKEASSSWRASIIRAQEFLSELPIPAFVYGWPLRHKNNGMTPVRRGSFTIAGTHATR